MVMESFIGCHHLSPVSPADALPTPAEGRNRTGKNSRHRDPHRIALCRRIWRKALASSWGRPADRWGRGYRPDIQPRFGVHLAVSDTRQYRDRHRHLARSSCGTRRCQHRRCSRSCNLHMVPHPPACPDPAARSGIPLCPWAISQARKSMNPSSVQPFSLMILAASHRPNGSAKSM